MEIIKLPKIGSAVSIKTAKQGRIGNIKNCTKEITDFTKCKNGYKLRSFKLDTIEMTIRNCNRILNFNFSTEKQKYYANEFLKKRESRLIPLIKGIIRTLSLSHKEF